MATPIPTFDHAVLVGLAEVAGDATTGTKITALLGRLGIADNSGESTKWKRLLHTFKVLQARDGAANGVLGCVQEMLTPALFVKEPERFEELRGQLNQTLHFVGLELSNEGKYRKIQAASNLDQVQERANRLRSTLLTRDIHPDVLACCRKELVQQNYFHAVLEATKSVAEKIRSKAGIQGDGYTLVDAAFGKGQGIPLLAFNKLETDTEKSEHTGLVNLMKGTFSAFRNPTAHEPKTKWEVTEQDALELMALVSMLHRRLDKAVRTR